MENIITFELDEIITKYDQKIFRSLQKKDFAESENYLTDFCLELLGMLEEEQLFIARIYFISIITDITRVHNRKNLLHPRTLSAAYDVISIIEEWENITEYLLNIPW